MTMSTEQRTDGAVFRVTFTCENCGDVFDRSYGPETVVEPRDDRIAVIDPTEFGQTSYIDCPTCLLDRYVTIDNRSPLNDE